MYDFERDIYFFQGFPMKKYVIFLALIVAVVVSVIAAITLADSIKFFHPGVPYSAQVHNGLVCGAIVFLALLIDLGALGVFFLCDTDTSRNPPT